MHNYQLFTVTILITLSIISSEKLSSNNMGNIAGSNNNTILPVNTTFKLPANIPVWPKGDGFASGIIDLGGLKVSQISTFNKVWTTQEGGPDNLGATFFEPTGIPEGFFMLGSYSQPNNKPFFGFVLVAKDDSSTGALLKKPIDYTLVYTSNSTKIKQDKDGYVWLPTPPEGYKALGHVVTNTPHKPSLDKIMCVRSDFTEQCETYSWIWGPQKSEDDKGFNVHSIRPTNRGIKAQGVLVGTFLAHVGATTTSTIPLSCLKTSNINNFSSSMPNLPQINALVQAYAPIMYLHPDEKYQPCSTNWFFSNGGLLYHKGEESKPVAIEPNGSNLPQLGSNDGTYWLDLPSDKTNHDRVKKGDFKTCQAYIHVKPMFGGTFTDLAMWVFYPFNGPGTAKLGLISKVPLGKIGEHVGDWEHVTLRISNFNGWLWNIYFSQHSKGQWVDASMAEFQNGNKPVAYSSLNGHALYPKAGLVLQGTGDIGIRNDTAKSNMVVEFGVGYEIVAAGEYLEKEIVVEPPWLNYFREWGPKINYDVKEELEKLEKVFPLLKELQDILPSELLGEEGPTGPKVKNNWGGDEYIS
ncbi:uncharacterized protein LOC107614212 isoform X1 [Arachis ipaensis]|uniref:uncharacterized protein LOC107614212 isoform X1 n=1 Tax=Arachis ipaensis TaxID=130454 RepID=UPI000A2B4C08|nr:uncharacterized protein LOC107614212 isoform X1 [Arachis ipaensis]XP_025672815.1 uncharacterized protein LOC112772146 isoform X1 [Arachis hypogaea]